MDEIVEYKDESNGGLLPLELYQICLEDLDNVTRIVRPNNHGQKLVFKMLNQLTVNRCNQLEYLLPLYVLKDLQQLKIIEISNCDMLKQVFEDEQKDPQILNSDFVKALPNLRSFKLSNLGKLESICSGACHVTSRSLIEMTIDKCPKFIFTYADEPRTIQEPEPSKNKSKEPEPSKNKSKEMTVIPSKLENLSLTEVNHLEKMYKDSDRVISYTCLTSLHLKNCNKLKHLFSLSMAQTLRNLQVLSIISCESIKQIIIKREPYQSENVEFRQVKSLIIEQLPYFIGLCNDKGVSVKWLALAEVKVVECPKIQRYMLGKVDRPLLKNVTVENCLPWAKQNPDESNIAHLFEFTDELSNRKELTISDSNDLKQYLEMDLQKLHFSNLKRLVARKCDQQLNKFLSILLERAYELDKLLVENCGLLEHVFILPKSEGTEQGILKKFPKLDTIQLCSLPKLKNIWNVQDPWRIVELGRLVKLEIIGCGLPKSAFSTAILEKLDLLEELKIESCMIEEVVEDDDPKVQERTIHYLKDLQLANLPELNKFSSGNCNFMFPNLLNLRIEKCPKLKVLIIQTLTNEKNCSSLGSLVLLSNSTNLTGIKICDCKILEEIHVNVVPDTNERNFSKLKSIVLKNLPVLSSFSLGTHEFPSLEELRIINCPMLENLNKDSASLVLFDCMNEDSPAGEGKMKIPSPLKSMELTDLANMQLWKQDPKIPVFKNLATLNIRRCSRIENLFSISVAQNLSVLKLLTLYGCENMVQVLGGGGGGGEGDSKQEVFQELETLVLKHLPKLTSFCEDDVDFGKFPKLKMVRVENVPKMETFVKKPLKTPQLTKVHVTHITKCWKEDLNKTIQSIWKNHRKLEQDLWESNQNCTRHHTDTAESSSQMEMKTASWRFKEAAEKKLLEDIYQARNGHQKGIND